MGKTSPSIIGQKIKYFDFLGCEQYGKIVAVEPYPLDPNQVYVYIEDEEAEFNRYDLPCSNGSVIMYAEMRLSSEIYCLDD